MVSAAATVFGIEISMIEESRKLRQIEEAFLIVIPIFDFLWGLLSHILGLLSDLCVESRHSTAGQEILKDAVGLVQK